MGVLTKELLRALDKAYSSEFDCRVRIMDQNGRSTYGVDALGNSARIRRERLYAMHQSITLGVPFTFAIGPSIASWLVAMVDKRDVYGAVLGGEAVAVGQGGTMEDGIRYLAGAGFSPRAAAAFWRRLPRLEMPRIEAAANGLQRIFYELTGWRPELMEENRLRFQQKQQITQAIEDQRQRGDSTAYPFEKERVLLSLIRAGDRPGARKVLNEMLAAMYLSTPKLVLLRARAIEMMGYLTRAAVEDSPGLEPLIERNHAWMAKLIRATDFEALAHVLTDALNDFIEGIYLAGFNRANRHVSRALDFINANYMKSLSLAMVAGSAGISSYRLAHLVKAHTGRTIVQLINQTRIEHARRLLEQTGKSCTDIAYEIGYSDQSYFIRHFRRQTGITPARYRRTRRDLPAETGSAP